MFAVIHTGGKQYKVEKGMKLDIERIDAEENANFKFDKVLLIGDGGKTLIGTPVLEGASVSSKVIAHKRGDKVRVFKMKPKKRYQITRGHRQELTTVEITDIKATGSKTSTAKKTSAKKPAEKKTAVKKTAAKTTKPEKE